jgi:hypothetical protein
LRGGLLLLNAAGDLACGHLRRGGGALQALFGLDELFDRRGDLRIELLRLLIKERFFDDGQVIPLAF